MCDDFLPPISSDWTKRLNMPTILFLISFLFPGVFTSSFSGLVNVDIGLLDDPDGGSKEGGRDRERERKAINS